MRAKSKELKPRLTLMTWASLNCRESSILRCTAVVRSVPWITPHTNDDTAIVSSLQSRSKQFRASDFRRWKSAALDAGVGNCGRWNQTPEISGVGQCGLRFSSVTSVYERPGSPGNGVERYGRYNAEGNRPYRGTELLRCIRWLSAGLVDFCLTGCWLPTLAIKVPQLILDSLPVFGPG